MHSSVFIEINQSGSNLSLAHSYVIAVPMLLVLRTSQGLGYLGIRLHSYSIEMGAQLLAVSIHQSFSVSEVQTSNGVAATGFPSCSIFQKALSKFPFDYERPYNGRFENRSWQPQVLINQSQATQITFHSHSKAVTPETPGGVYNCSKRPGISGVLEWRSCLQTRSKSSTNACKDHAPNRLRCQRHE